MENIMDLFEVDYEKKLKQKINALRKILRSDIYKKYCKKDEVSMLREIKVLEKELAGLMSITKFCYK